MATLTTTATAQEISETVKAVVEARKYTKSRETKGLRINGKKATVFDLNEQQLKDAVSDACFNLKSYNGRQLATGLIEETVANALLYILENPQMWDTDKAPFYTSLVKQAKIQLKFYGNKMFRDKTENTSYSYGSATDSEGEETEFNYTNGELASAEIEHSDYVTAKLNTFDKKERAYIELVMDNETRPVETYLEAEQIAEQLGFSTYGAFRVWLTRFKAKYNLTEVLKASIGKKYKAKKNKVTGETVQKPARTFVSSKKCKEIEASLY